MKKYMGGGEYFSEKACLYPPTYVPRNEPGGLNLINTVDDEDTCKEDSFSLAEASEVT